MNPYQFDSREHLHTYEGKPLTGTSTVMSVISKPLSYWASGLAVAEFGWTNPKFTSPEERLKKATIARLDVLEKTPKEYLELLDKAYKAHATKLKDSAQAGTDRHALVEAYVKDCIKLNEGRPTDVGPDEIRSFIEWAKVKIDIFLFSEIHTYSEKHWLGGIVDVGAKLKDGSIAIIDIKSSKDAYASQFWQIALYDIQLSETGGFTAQGEKILEPIKADCHIVFPFGMPEPTGVIRWDVAKNKEAGLACLTIYRQLQQIEQD